MCSSDLVSCCFWFQKFYTENIVEIEGNLFLRKYKFGKLPEPEDHLGGEPPGAHTPLGAAWGGAAPNLGVVALAGPRHPPFAYITPSTQKP